MTSDLKKQTTELATALSEGLRVLQDVLRREQKMIQALKLQDERIAVLENKITSFQKEAGVIDD